MVRTLFAILRDKQLTSLCVIIRSLLFGVTYSAAQKPHPVVLLLNCGTRRCHGLSAVHLGPELLWESYSGASRYTTSSSDPQHFCRANSSCYEIRDGMKSANSQQKIRGQP